MTEQNPENDEATETDTTSDPKLDDGKSSDWTDEGGATPKGPATDEDQDTNNH